VVRHPRGTGRRGNDSIQLMLTTSASIPPRVNAGWWSRPRHTRIRRGPGRR
jgi:hypothetical protein